MEAEWLRVVREASQEGRHAAAQWLLERIAPDRHNLDVKEALDLMFGAVERELGSEAAECVLLRIRAELAGGGPVEGGVIEALPAGED